MWHRKGQILGAGREHPVLGVSFVQSGEGESCPLKCRGLLLPAQRGSRVPWGILSQALTSLRLSWGAFQLQGWSTAQGLAFTLLPQSASQSQCAPFSPGSQMQLMTVQQLLSLATTVSSARAATELGWLPPFTSLGRLTDFTGKTRQTRNWQNCSCYQL